MSRTTAPLRTGMRPRRATAILIAVLLGLAGALVPAASASASVQGTIVDQANVPVVGIAAEIHEQISNAVVGSLTTDASGQFTYLPVLADGDYGLFVLDGAADTPGDTYGYNTIQFTVSGGNATVPTLVLSRYVNISGVIDNWSALGMGDVYVEVYRYYPVGDYWTGTSFDVTSTDGTFTIPLTVTTGTYTLWFSPDDYASPYVESFLGGEFYDPAVATTFHLDDGVGTSTIVMHMRDAAFVYGTVTSDGTTPIPGILVGADEQTTYPTPSHYTEATTDADGDYRLSVRPNATYVVYAYDSPLYLGMTYDGYDACGCQFTPVVSTIATPKTGVDFDLVLASTALYLEGFVLDDQLSLGNPLYGVYVHLYKPVPGGWTETDVSYSDGSGYFELLLPAFGSYRVRFELAGVWLPVIDGVSFEGSGGPPDLISGCYVDTGALDATSVSGNSAFVIFAGLDLAGGCGPEPAPSSGGTGGHSTPGHGRTSFGGGGNLVAATPTPTPSATPTSGPSPSSSPSDSPSASPTPDPVPAGDAGFPLWIILIIVLVLGIIVTIIVIVRRR